MADEATAQNTSFAQNPRVRIGAAVLVLAIIGVGVWFYRTAGQISTDDAQVDAHVTQMSARVSGTLTKVNVDDNQMVDAGTVLVELDPSDYKVAVEKARAELADAQATAVAAQSNVPITSTTSTSNVTTARGGVAQAAGGVAASERELEAAKARLVTARAHLREAEANAAKSAKDVERLRGLLAKDEVSQSQFDTATAAAEAQKAAVDSARSQVTEAEAGIRVGESKLDQSRAGEQQAHAELATAQTGPSQVAISQARAAAAEAKVAQAKATLEQAELNLQYTTVKAPIRGVVSKKGINTGQVVQAGQPLLAIVGLDDVWITANYKETQLKDVRAGQKAVIGVDALGREYTGKVDSISGATGARFSLLPPENATGNYVKVVQRVPVKIVFDPGQDAEHLLRPGMSATPTVYTR
jgi:membrane fusion protein, multidrug efflux system